MASTTRIVGVSVMCMQHSSNTQWRLLITCIPGTEWWLNLWLEKAIFRKSLKDVWKACVVRMWKILAVLGYFNSGGKNNSNRPHSDPSTTAAIMETTDRVDAMILNNCCITTWTAGRNRDWKTSSYGRHLRGWQQKDLCKIGAENCYHWAQTSPMKHLRKTSPVQWERQISFL